MKTMTKRALTLALTIGIALGLTACGDSESTPDNLPKAEEPETAQVDSGPKEVADNSDPEAQKRVETTQLAYAETYDVVFDYVEATYSGSDLEVLCEDQQSAIRLELDWDEFVIPVMRDAGITVEGESRLDSPEFMGAYDATDDAVWDLCEEHFPS